MIKQLHSLIRQGTVSANREKHNWALMKEITAKRGSHRLHYTRVRKRFNSWGTRTKLLRLDSGRNEILCCADTCCTNPFAREATAPYHAFQKAAFQPREVTLRPSESCDVCKALRDSQSCLGATSSWAIQHSKFSSGYRTYPDTSKMWLEAQEKVYFEGTNGGRNACLQNMPQNKFSLLSLA